MTVYECDLTDRPPVGQGVKLIWPGVNRTSEPEILKELGVFPDEGVKAHTPAPLASPMPPMMDTGLFRKRLGSPHFPESRCLRRLVITICWSLFPVWDLTPDGFPDVWIQCLLCMLDSSVSGVHD